LSANENELTEGLMKLKNDIATGKINNIIEQYESDRGDYLFVSAEKE
jgi:hypothetical protein